MKVWAVCERAVTDGVAVGGDTREKLTLQLAGIKDLRLPLGLMFS